MARVTGKKGKPTSSKQQRAGVQGARRTAHAAASQKRQQARRDRKR